MDSRAKSIRPFLGAKDFEISRSFYCDLGFTEIIIDPNMSLFQWGDMRFYLQNAFVKDWIDNTMVFFEVDHVDDFWTQLTLLGLDIKYEKVRIVPVKSYDWGKECFIYDPSGILWHVGEFYK